MVDFKDAAKDKNSLLDHVTDLVVKDKRFPDSTDLHSELTKIHLIAKVNDNYHNITIVKEGTSVVHGGGGGGVGLETR